MEEKRLYSLPHGERAYFDVASLYESEIDPEYDPKEDSRWRERKWVIEEWSVWEPIETLPRTDYLLEWMLEAGCEEHDHDWSLYENGCWSATDKDIVAAAEALREVIASKVTWRQCKDKLVEHILSFNEAGEPVLNGSAIYTKESA